MADERAVDLGAVFTLYDIDMLKHKLLDALDRSGDCLRLDGSDIEQLDGAGLQLLASLILEAREAKKTIEWEGASDELLASAHLLGLSGLLGLDQQKAGE
ncbi:MAG: STAS domain-containing protein [Sedimenticola sp.]|nr:STAS domain-containing protein [Sedimenticola sp.]